VTGRKISALQSFLEFGTEAEKNKAKRELAAHPFWTISDEAADSDASSVCGDKLIS
jgi:hypothetical protein